MQISKQETERLLKAAQSNKITAETLRQNSPQYFMG